MVATRFASLTISLLCIAPLAVRAAAIYRETSLTTRAPKKCSEVAAGLANCAECVELKRCAFNTQTSACVTKPVTTSPSILTIKSQCERFVKVENADKDAPKVFAAMAPHVFGTAPGLGATEGRHTISSFLKANGQDIGLTATQNTATNLIRFDKGAKLVKTVFGNLYTEKNIEDMCTRAIALAKGSTGEHSFVVKSLIGPQNNVCIKVFIPQSATENSAGTCFPNGIGFVGGKPAGKPGDKCSPSIDGAAAKYFEIPR